MKSVLVRLMLAAGLALMGVMPGLAFAQADGAGTQQQPAASDDASTLETIDPATATAGPATLECTTVALAPLATGPNGNRFVCRVGGAQATETAFAVHATSAAADPHLVATLSAATCTGSLAAGVGVCLGDSLDRVSGSIGQLTLVATLEPSGTTLGPVPLVVTPAQPQPRAFSPPPPPVTSFPPPPEP